MTKAMDYVETDLQHRERLEEAFREDTLSEDELQQVHAFELQVREGVRSDLDGELERLDAELTEDEDYDLILENINFVLSSRPEFAALWAKYPAELQEFITAWYPSTADLVEEAHGAEGEQDTL